MMIEPNEGDVKDALTFYGMQIRQMQIAQGPKGENLQIVKYQFCARVY